MPASRRHAGGRCRLPARQVLRWRYRRRSPGRNGNETPRIRWRPVAAPVLTAHVNPSLTWRRRPAGAMLAMAERPAVCAGSARFDATPRRRPGPRRHATGGDQADLPSFVSRKLHLSGTHAYFPHRVKRCTVAPEWRAADGRRVRAAAVRLASTSSSRDVGTRRFHATLPAG